MRIQDRRQRFAWGLPGLLAVFLLSAPAHARQVPGLGMPTEHPLPGGVKRVGAFETDEVRFEGLPLFEIASPAVIDHDKPGSQTPVEKRAEQIEADLAILLEALLSQDRGTSSDAATLIESGDIRIDSELQNGVVVLVAQGRGFVMPKPLLSVTTEDAEYQRKPRQLLAQEWKYQILTAASDAVRARRPDAVRARLVEVRNITLIVLGAHAFFFALNYGLLRRQNRLREEIELQRAAAQTDVASAAATASPQSDGTAIPSVSLGTREAALSRENRFKVLAFLRWLFLWITLAFWIAGGTFILFAFPQTRRVAAYLMATPVLVLASYFAATLVNRVTGLIVDRAIASWQTNQILDRKNAAHYQARLATIFGAIHALKSVLVYLIALIWVVSQLDLVPWSVVTIGAIVTLVVSFAAQSLVKDVMIGVLILVEDQFDIGDYITLPDTTGRVEYMNLRMTQLRTDEGRLVTIPNSAIVKVENLSRNWSAITVEFEVPPTTDVDNLLAAVREIAETMAQEAPWKVEILTPVQWLGISKISRAAITIGLSIQTQPLQHQAVARELRRRIKQRLDREGMEQTLPLAIAAD